MTKRQPRRVPALREPARAPVARTRHGVTPSDAKKPGSASVVRPASIRVVPLSPEVIDALTANTPDSLAKRTRRTAKAAKARKRWTPGRVIRWAAGVAALVLLAVGGWAVFLFVQLQHRIYVPLPPTPTVVVPAVRATPVASLDGEMGQVATASPTADLTRSLPAGRINILVLGTDKRPDDPDHFARSDTILLANVDTIDHQVRIMSIPRDLVVYIPAYGENKINSAYFFGEYYGLPGGGQALSVQTVSQFFNVPIDYYITVNFQGFRQVVDSVGGVDIDVPYSIDDYNYPTDEGGDLYGEKHVHFDAGPQHMDGETALEYARTRHADNDFARSKRQLQIILAVKAKASSLNLLPSLPGLMDALGGMVETNIPFDQQLGLAQLGYGITASNIMTSSIDSTLISPVTLADGSEGLKLNQRLARPMLDDFFGTSSSGSGGKAETAPDAQPTVLSSVKAKPVRTPTAAPARKKP